MAKLDSNELNSAHKEIKDEARQRVAARGLLQFRADPETVLAILKAADEHQMPVGALLRQWVQERLQLDAAIAKAPDLVQRLTLLEEAVTDLKQRVK